MGSLVGEDLECEFSVSINFSGRDRQGLLAVVVVDNDTQTSITVFAIPPLIGKQLNSKTILTCNQNNIYLILKECSRFYEFNKDGLLIQSGYFQYGNSAINSNLPIDAIDVFETKEILKRRDEKISSYHYADGERMPYRKITEICVMNNSKLFNFTL